MNNVSSITGKINKSNFDTGSTKNTIAFPAFTSEKAAEKIKGQPDKDTLVNSETKNTELLPEVGAIAIIFCRLPQDTIKEINKTGRLPKDLMITQTYDGRYRLAWKNPITEGKILGGTQTLPQHLELRNDVLGFTRVVPKGYDHFILRKDLKTA